MGLQSAPGAQTTLRALPPHATQESKAPLNGKLITHLGCFSAVYSRCIAMVSNLCTIPFLPVVLFG